MDEMTPAQAFRAGRSISYDEVKMLKETLKKVVVIASNVEDLTFEAREVLRQADKLISG